MSDESYYVLDHNGEPQRAGPLAHYYWLQTADPARRLVQETGIKTLLGVQLRVVTVFFGESHRVWEARVTIDGTVYSLKSCQGGREQAEALHVDCLKRACENLGIQMVHEPYGEGRDL